MAAEIKDSTEFWEKIITLFDIKDTENVFRAEIIMEVNKAVEIKIHRYGEKILDDGIQTFLEEYELVKKVK